MLLKSYTMEIFNNECMPSAMSVQCFAYLDEDVGEALPYLNTVLGGHTYTREPPSVTFKVQGKLITVHSRKIAVNALKDEQEAAKIVEWIKREINAAWQNRSQILPSHKAAPTPKVFEILKLLPRTNCQDCGLPTCMVFAVQAAEGVKRPEDCPSLDDVSSRRLADYLSKFRFDF